jgi:hypothetical protein
MNNFFLAKAKESPQGLGGSAINPGGRHAGNILDSCGSMQTPPTPNTAGGLSGSFAVPGTTKSTTTPGYSHIDKDQVNCSRTIMGQSADCAPAWNHTNSEQTVLFIYSM